MHFRDSNYCQEMPGGGSGVYSPRIAALVAEMLLRGVAGDRVRESFGCCAGSTANRRGGRNAAEIASSRCGPRSFLAEAAEKLFAGSERYLAVPGAAWQGTALGAYDCGNGRDGGADPR